MKKFFTLIAAVAMAASVNAQIATYAVAEGDAVTAGDQCYICKQCNFDLLRECWYSFCGR